MKNVLLKTGIVLISILLSVLLAGLYGALHDQITYSISSEYFTVYKFDQFGFQDRGNNSPRLTTALIGFLATWWVGLYIGIFLSLVGLIHKATEMFKIVMKSVLITLLIAFIFGITGGIFGLITIEENPSCFPYEIIQCRNFYIVGSIHNLGYIGGGIGAVIASVYQIIKKRKAFA